MTHNLLLTNRFHFVYVVDAGAAEKTCFPALQSVKQNHPDDTVLDQLSCSKGRLPMASQQPGQNYLPGGERPPPPLKGCWGTEDTIPAALQVFTI